MDPVEARDLYPITRQYIFMNHAGVSPMSERARAAVESMAGQLSTKPLTTPLAMEEADRLRESLGRLFNCAADHIALTRSTAHGISLLAAGLDWQPGDNVVGARGEYPANVYPWVALRPRGVEFRLADNAGGRVSPEAVLGRVDGRTRVVALSHVEFWNGYRVDLETIGEECRKRGVILAVDAIQSAGALRLDLSRLPVDYAAAGSYKWLLGPQGIGFAWCHPDLLPRITPVLVGTSSVKDRMNYFSYPTDRVDFETTARRLEEGNASLLDMAAFSAAVELFLEVGPEVVEKRVLELAQRLAEGLDRQGYEVVGPWPREENERSGIVSFRKPGAPPQEILRDLQAAHVVGRIHADFVRLSPHFYNTEDEVDRVIEVLAQQSAVRQ
ncbi:MAG TPA: aminotransferase class V-fold PLP-dependent enzyme [Candidatus Dormibacteraeota bacterium]